MPDNKTQYIYFDTTDLGQLAAGSYDDEDSAAEWIIDRLGEHRGRILLSPLHLMEIDAAGDWLVDAFFELLDSVPWSYTNVWPSQLYDYEALSALIEAETGEPLKLSLVVGEVKPEDLREELVQLRPTFERCQELNRQFTVADSFAKAGRRFEGEVTTGTAAQAVEETEDEEWQQIQNTIAEQFDDPNDVVDETFPPTWKEQLEELTGQGGSSSRDTLEVNWKEVWPQIARTFSEYSDVELPSELPDSYADQGFSGYMRFLIESFPKADFEQAIVGLSRQTLPAQSVPMDDIHASLPFIRAARRCKPAVQEHFGVTDEEFWELVSNVEDRRIPTLTLAAALRKSDYAGMQDRFPEKGDLVDIWHLAYLPYVTALTADKRTVHAIRQYTSDEDVPRRGSVIRGGRWNGVREALGRLADGG